jgi:hypothetical protein
VLPLVVLVPPPSRQITQTATPERREEMRPSFVLVLRCCKLGKQIQEMAALHPAELLVRRIMEAREKPTSDQSLPLALEALPATGLRRVVLPTSEREAVEEAALQRRPTPAALAAARSFRWVFTLMTSS